MQKNHFMLTNGSIVLPNQLLDNHALIIKNDLIEAIIPDDDPQTQSIPQLDVQNRLITPGLIDIHIHGALGASFNQPTPESYATITAENARRGVTSLLATTATDTIENLVKCLEFVGWWMDREVEEIPTGANILGTHVEGPYFSLAQAGAQNPAQIRNPDDGTPAQLLAHADVIKLMTYAPELPGAVELTRELMQRGVVPAAGHSSAKEDEIRACMDEGLRHMIHIWSGQSTTVREGPWRKPGLLEVTLTDDTVTAEMITDNKHLPPTLMKLAYKCLGPDRLCIISDATSGAGLPEGSRFGIGGFEYEVHDGVGMLFDRTSFAGSTTLLNEMIPILIEVVGVPLVEAVRMATLTPARIIGVDKQKGSLAVGKDADIAIFNDDFTIAGVIIGGVWYTEL